MNVLPLKICMDATAHVVNWICIIHVRVRVAAFWQLNAILANRSRADYLFVFFGETSAPKPLQEISLLNIKFEAMFIVQNNYCVHILFKTCVGLGRK